jgi:DNA-binding NarL/FixJ family response regulator
MDKIKIILVDDHRIVRDGIKSLLQSEDDIEVVGEASNYSELINLLENKIPDVLILDIALPDMSGIEITKIMTLNYPAIRVIMLTMYTNEDFIFNSLKAGAKGYLPKNTTKKELIKAIKAVYNSEDYFSDEISNLILKSYIKKAKTSEQENEDPSKVLTRREEEILKLAAQGNSNREIAERLFISTRTVESHKNHIMNKLELKTNVDLIKFAIKNKIIDI